MKKFSLYLKESNEILGNILIIVDVQEQFSKFMYKPTPEKYVNAIKNYAKNFKEVYQIWDGHNYVDGKIQKINNPSYNFGEKMNFRKVYGTSASEKVKKLGEQTLNYKPDTKEGDLFKVNDDFKLDEQGESYIVRIENNHKWFYINKELANFFKTLKGKNVVIVGGADGECLHDIEVAMKSFGINQTPNQKYIYSSKTTS